MYSNHILHPNNHNWIRREANIFKFEYQITNFSKQLFMDIYCIKRWNIN